MDERDADVDVIEDEQITRTPCEVHGTRGWQRHVLCNNCGRVWQAASEKKPRFAPITCKCGVRLAPATPAELENGETIVFSGRAFCYLCFRRCMTKYGGQIPNWTPVAAQTAADVARRA